MTRKNADGHDPYADLDLVYAQEQKRGLSPMSSPAGRIIPKKSDKGLALDGTDLTGVGGDAIPE